MDTANSSDIWRPFTGLPLGCAVYPEPMGAGYHGLQGRGVSFGKTDTTIEIDRLFITFSGNVVLEGLYLEDRHGDTLIHSRSLEANMAIGPLVWGNALHLNKVEWKGLTAHMARADGKETFNFHFLVEAFALADTTAVASTAEPMDIRLGTIDFEDFKVTYTDKFLGIDGFLDLGKLTVETKEIDLQAMRFGVHSLSLSDTKASYKQTKPLPSKKGQTAPLPYFSADDLQVNNVRIAYETLPDSTKALVDIGELALDLPSADLSDRRMDLNSLSLKNSTVDLNVPAPKETDTLSKGQPAPLFRWPDYDLTVASLHLENNALNFRAGNAIAKPKSVLDPTALGFSQLHLLANDVAYRPGHLEWYLRELSFQESSGWSVQQLAMKGNVSEDQASIAQLVFQMDHNRLSGALEVKYVSFQDFLNTPGASSVDFHLDGMYLDLNDLFQLLPNLEENGYLKTLAQQPIRGKMAVNGKLADLEVEQLAVQWGGHTSLEAKGSLQQLTQTDSLSFKIHSLALATVQEDVLAFIPQEALGITVPQTLTLKGSASGRPNDLIAYATVQLPEGSISLKGQFGNDAETAVSGQLTVNDLPLDQLLNNEQWGPLSFTMDFAANGSTLNDLDSQISTNFKQLHFRTYDFSNLELSGDITKGKGNVQFSFQDKNLNVNALFQVQLDTTSTALTMQLHIIGADLFALGITKDDIKVALLLTAEYDGGPTDYAVGVHVENGIAVYDDKQYQMGIMALKAEIDSVRTQLRINSDFLNGHLTSNAAPNAIEKALTSQFKNYFSTVREPQPSQDSVSVEMAVDFRPIPLITEVFFRNIHRLDPILVVANFNSATQNLNGEVRISSVEYAGVALDSLHFVVQGNANNLDFTAGFAALTADPILIKKTVLEGHLQNKELQLNFNAYNEDKKLMHIAADLTMQQDLVQLHISPEELILNGKEWRIPEENEIVWGNDRLGFTKVALSQNEQELTIGNDLNLSSKEHIALVFTDFRLQTFASLLNADEALASGRVAGNFVVENPFDATGILADFTVNGLQVMGHSLGNLSLDASSQGTRSYDFNLALKEGGADLDITGSYAATASGAALDLDVDFNRIALQTIQGFTNGAIEEGAGHITGHMDISGTTAAPQYDGSLTFDGVSFTVATLNSVFKITNETLDLDTDGIYLDNFEIADANDNNFTLNGSILTKSLINPSFDLTLNTTQFRLLNSTAEDNELFYGTASVDADLSIGGDLELPMVKGKLALRDVTDMTYVVPKAQLDVEERDGVVIFVNRQNPDAILTRNDQEETSNFFQGFDVAAVLEISEDADFHIIIDERTGDNIEVSGVATLHLNVLPNGRIDLTGRYELNSRHYETSLYNLVNRRFTIQSGSTITWQGNPMDARLDVTAVYELETAAAPLMAAVTSGQDASITGKYRQVLPFMVYLNVDGELLEPELSFGLDMPEDEQGTFGGAVYNRVRQLNQQEAELNRQVFSLLALNRFYPEAGSDGSAGGTAALARDNINKVLSGEMNAFSDRIFGETGFEVDFDLDSFTDYQGDTPQDRTQLNINAKKKLFNERLIVTAGSAVDVEGSAQPGQENTPIIGNVSLEYLLTPNGRYRLRGFRKSEYENILDGQLIVTGLALIFNREFNRFSQLFNPLKETEEQEKPTDPSIEKK
jgi:translocation and assembly module TamB